jgi:hypothetical protein
MNVSVDATGPSDGLPASDHRGAKGDALGATKVAVVVLAVVLLAITAVVSTRSWLVGRPYHEQLHLRSSMGEAPAAAGPTPTLVISGATAACPSASDGGPALSVRINASDVGLADVPCAESADERRLLANVITAACVLLVIGVVAIAIQRRHRSLRPDRSPKP